MLQLIGTPNYQDHADAIRKLGVLADRQDAAGDTMHLARELEQVSAQTFDVFKNPIMGRLLFPFVNELQDGAETFSYDMYDGITKAEWIANYAVRVGQADAFKTRVTVNSRQFGSSYEYTIEDLARSSFAGGRPLDRERARLCRIGHEQFIDDLIALGDSSRSISGVPTLLADLGFSAATAGTAGQPWQKPVVGTWDAATATADLMKDLDRLIQTPEQNTKNMFKATRLALPMSVRPLMRQLFSTSGDSRSVEAVWLGNNPGISIDYWWRLDTASAGSGPRALAWANTPDVVKFILAYDFRELPPQAVNYTFQILTFAKVVGVVSAYPLGLAQMDLDGSP